MQSLARRLATAPRRDWPDRPVPIALAITELDVGGAERALVALATRLDRRRWAPRVVGLGPEGPLAAPLRAAGIPTDCLDVDPGRPGRAVARLAAWLRSPRPELLQSFLFHANLAGRLAGRRAGVAWIVGGLRVAEREKTWHRRLDRWTIGLAAGSVCVSRGVYEFSRTVGRLPFSRLAIIPNGVDFDPIDAAAPADRASIGVPPSSTLAICVGRLTRQKGIDVLLNAAGRVAEARSDWRLLIVGDGPERARLEAQAAADPRLAGRVTWLGRRDDVPSLLKAADLVVLPSRWEGMPNVVLEAMAAGRPVVATAVEGSAELVEPGGSGWLVPPEDPAALAAALIEAAADSAQAARFGASGRARVAAEFDPGVVARRYQGLWARLIGLERPEDWPDPAGLFPGPAIGR